MMKIRQPETGNKIAIIYEDHQLFGDTFASWLEKSNLFSSVQTFYTREELLHFFFRKQEYPVYLFADYYIGSSTSLSLLADIRRIYPAVRIIIVSSVTNA